MADFTYVPSTAFSSETTPRTKVAKFGDGYSQRTAFGINTLDQVWTLQFQSRTLTEAAAIESFFQTKAGVTSFTWLPPGESTEVRVICTKWSNNYESAISRTLGATFERVYGS